MGLSPSYCEGADQRGFPSEACGSLFPEVAMGLSPSYCEGAEPAWLSF